MFKLENLNIDLKINVKLKIFNIFRLLTHHLYIGRFWTLCSFNIARLYLYLQVCPNTISFCQKLLHSLFGKLGSNRPFRIVMLIYIVIFYIIVFFQWTRERYSNGICFWSCHNSFNSTFNVVTFCNFKTFNWKIPISTVTCVLDWCCRSSMKLLIFIFTFTLASCFRKLKTSTF